MLNFLKQKKNVTYNPIANKKKHTETNPDILSKTKNPISYSILNIYRKNIRPEKSIDDDDEDKIDGNRHIIILQKKATRKNLNKLHK